MELANKENVIGFLGGMDIPGINDFLVGYIEGAKSVNPDVKVIVSYAGDFGDPAKGKELGLVQYNSGADISFNVAGGTGLGLIDAAKDKNKYAIGVDSDQAMLFKDSDPEKASHIVSSAVKRIDQAIFNAVKAHQDGTLKYGTHNEMGVAENGVGLAKNEFYEKLPQDIKDQITAIEQKLVNGEIKVGTAFGVDSAKINELRESVKP
jgi:basic membrane protein A